MNMNTADKEFELPTATVILFDNEDVITTSGEKPEGVDLENQEL